MIPIIRKPFLLFLLLGLVFLTGCWDKEELNEIAFVMAMGVDQTQGGLYHVSFQIVNPGQISGGETRQRSQGVAVVTYSETGESLFAAIRKVSKKVPRSLAFSHTAVLIIGEKMAKTGGLEKIIDFTERYYKFRSTTLVLIARGGQARPILNIVSSLEKVPALNIVKIMKKTATFWGENTESDINDVVQGLTSKSQGLSLSGIKLVGNAEEGKTTAENEQVEPAATIEINGVALFKNGKLQGWLDKKKARGIGWIRDKIKRTVVTMKCTKKGKGSIAVDVIRSHTSLKAKISNGKPEMTVSIHSEGDLEEASCAVDLTNPKVILALDHKISTEIKSEVMSTVKQAKKEKNDVFGFGEAVERTDPKAWKKMKKHWGKTFADMDVHVKSQFFIRNTGLRTKPHRMQKK